MPPKAALPGCGFSVTGSKNGQLPLKVEKRARGKKVTIIPNVFGDATKLARALMSMLSVGGTVRRGESGFQLVEVQGDQTVRVTQALLEFGCLQGMTKAAIDALRKERSSSEKGELVVDRTTASKFLAQTQTGGKLSPQEERRRVLEQEAEFYGNFWQAAAVPQGAIDDFSDIWEETLSEEKRAEVRELEGPGRAAQDLSGLNMGLRILGMFAEVGHAVKAFWENNAGMTLTQLRKITLNPGARLIDEGPGRRQVPSNLRSRQKISDFKSSGRGSGGGHYFSVTCRAIDNYERGITPNKENAPEAEKPEEPKMKVEEDEDGWNTAVLSYCLPLEVPACRLEDEERSVVSKNALRKLEAELSADLDRGVREKVPGVQCRLDSSLFGVDLHVREQDFLHAGRRDNGKAPDQQDKEEMRLEKKLREICTLRKRQVDGAKLEKNQADKLLRKEEHFREVAELKLRRAEKELLRVFKRYREPFRETFFELEWNALYGDESSKDEVHHQPGTFDVSSCQGSVVVSRDGFRAETQSATWVGCCLHLRVRNGEVGAFAVEVLEGIVRLGWAASASSASDLGADHSSWGFGSTGKKVTGGVFEPYGQSFKTGDVIHCEAERENGRLRIGYAKNNEPLGVAFDAADEVGRHEGLSGAVCGKAFKLRLISAESMLIDEAPGLDNFREFDPPRQVLVINNFFDDSDKSDYSDSCLQLQEGEMLNVSSDDGEGWLFGFYLDPEDPDDGGWFPVSCVQFIDEAEEGNQEVDAPSHEQPEDAGAWNTEDTVATTLEAWSAEDSREEEDREKRIDPESGDAHTFHELEALYAGQYTPEEIADYWRDVCTPLPAPSHEAVSLQNGHARNSPATVHNAAPLQASPLQNGHASPNNTIAASVRSAVLEAAMPSLSDIEGLEEWLSSLSLLKYADRALQWCDDMGAAEVKEVKDNWEDFAEALELKPLEKKRIAKALAS